jgi:arylsulfatase
LKWIALITIAVDLEPLLPRKCVSAAEAAPTSQHPVRTIPGRWSADRAQKWAAQRPWLVGANFLPSTAINQLEMWQAETFDPATIDRELGWAADAGLNSMRVFLHDLPWKEDARGFERRIDQYLSISARHGIKTLFVLFDGVWNPVPKSGPQPAPTPYVHNSGWVQSPGKEILSHPERHAELKPYVQGILKRFATDERVLGWDLFNEPNNANAGKWGGTAAEDLSIPDKQRYALQLLRKTVRWARAVNPTQPLTVGVWGKPDWLDTPAPIERFSLANSDLISFHTYDSPEIAGPLFARLVKELDRPLWCTEYMARGAGSTFAAITPLLKKHRIAAFHWGLVSGKSQTIYPWDSWTKKYQAEPDLWFHDLFRTDGSAYRPAEVALLQSLGTDYEGSQQSATPLRKPLSAAEIAAGLKSHDRALFVKSGWIRDPYIARGPDDDYYYYYYLTGTTFPSNDPHEATEPYNTGLGATSLVGSEARVWRTKDFAEWESLGSPFTLRDGVWYQERRKRFEEVPEAEWRLWAPELHSIRDRWALVHTSPAPVQSSNLALSAGTQVAGPWSHPMGTAIGHRHDPSLFEDDDGSWWLIWGATQIAKLKPDFSGFASEPVRIGPSGETAKMGHEGCLIRKINGKYVLFGTGWSTGQMRRGSYNLYYAVSNSLVGPYGPRKFVGRFLGHGTPFQDAASQWWCTAFYNANVPPLPSTDIENRDLRDNAYTINEQGVTLVPLSMETDSAGELVIKAVDAHYQSPGPDEAQKF